MFFRKNITLEIRYIYEPFNLSDPPKVKLSVGANLDPSDLAEGSDVYLECAVRAHPKAYKVVWVHNVSQISY